MSDSLRKMLIFVIACWGIAGLFFIDRWQVDNWRAAKSIELENMARLCQNRLAVSIETRFNTVQTLAVYMALQKDKAPDGFARFAESLLRFNPPIRALQYADDQTRVTCVYPPKGNEVTIRQPMILLTDPLRGPFVRRTIEKRQAVIQGPFPLRQGGTGVVLRQPIFKGIRFTGLAIGVFDVPALVQEALAAVDLKRIDLQLRDASGTVFYGPDNLPGSILLRTVSVADASWTLACAWKTDALQTPRMPRMLVWLSCIGFLAAVLAMVGMSWAQAARLENRVADRTAELSRTAASLAGEIAERERVQKDLQARETQYRLLVENQNDLIVKFDAENRLRFASPNYCATFGVEQAAILDKTFFPRIHPEDIDTVKMSLASLRSPPHKTYHEERAETAEGWRWFGWSVRAIVDKTGRIMETVAVGRDITERRQAEQALRKSEEKFQKAFQNAPLLMTISALDDGRYIDVNDEFVKVTGYRSRVAIGKTSVELGFIREADRNQLAAALTTDGFVRDMTLELHRTDGATLFCLYSGELIDIDGQQRLLSIARDVTEQRAFQQALAVSEGKWRNILVNTPQVGVALDPEARIVFANDKLLELTGWQEEEVLGHNWFDLFIPEAVREEVRTVFDTVMYQEDTTGFSRYENEIVTKGGELRNVAWSNVISKNLDGRVVDVTCLGVDLTERRAAEKQLRDREQKYRSLFEQSNDGIILHDLEGRIVDTNSKIEHMLGYTKEAFGRMSVRDLHLAAEIEAVGKALESTRQEEHCTFETRFRTAGGEILDVDISASIVDRESGIMQGIVRDITARKKAERKLWETTERFQKVFDSQLDAILLLDARKPARVLECNQAALQMLQYPVEEMIDQTIEHLHVDQAHLATFQRTLQAAITRDGYLQNFSFSMKRRDGTAFPTEHTVLELKDNNGYRTGWVSVIRDLTEQKKIEAQLRQAQKMEAIGSLAGGIAHDFNNILFPIVGMAELLMEDLEPGTLAQDNAGEILKAGLRGSGLVKQILAFSRQGAQRKMPLRLQGLLEEVLKLARATIPANIDIQPLISPSCGLVNADPTQIHQVLMNMITNAYHAMGDSGGSITVRLDEKALEKDQLTGFTHTAGNFARLTVADNGGGIPADLLERIFEPYFTTKPQDKGTGLGLAVVYGIVEDHGGGIMVTSTPQKGTVFQVYLPMMTVAAATSPVETADSQPGGTERILLVDDEAPVAKVMEQMLVRLGYRVTVKLSSPEALAHVRELPEGHDLVITDMSMPGMTGCQLARELLADLPDLPVVICTGFNEYIDRQKAMATGIKGFLLKPITKAKLARKVREVLDTAAGRLSVPATMDSERTLADLQ